MRLPSATIDTVKGPVSASIGQTSAPVLLPNGKVPVPGTIFTNPKFANTYERILREAQNGGGSRENEIERARKAWSQGFCRRSHRSFLPHARGHGTRQAGVTAVS